MLLRLLETAIGAACGGLAAFLIFPIRTRDVVGNVAAEALQRLDEAVDRSVDRLSGNTQADPIDAVRAYDEALQAVRLQLLPLIAPARIARNEGMLTRLHLFAACGFYARGLAALAYESPGECPPDALERERTKIEGDIRQAIEILEGRAKTFTEAGPPAQTSGGEVLTYLERIDRAVRRLGKNLAASG